MTHKVKARYLGQITLRAGLPLGVFTICIYWLTPHLTQNLFASFPSQLADIH